MKSIWIEVLFNGIVFDNLNANSQKEAKEIIESVEKYGFDEYNQTVKEEWLEKFNTMPKVTARLKG